ncbi:MAG: SDR family oxidoreductase [Clostridia bacterium]|nr:SDR family oxidoreductase [Clostridia bacterium]
MRQNHLPHSHPCRYFFHRTVNQLYSSSAQFPRTVLITGGSRGIGAACVRTFTERGCQVAFFYEKSHELANALAADTGARAICVDIADRAAVFAAVEALVGEWGAISCLVNNAGIAQFSLFTDITEADWSRMIGVNLSGVFYCTQAALPGMIREKYGRIINISSIWGLTGASCEVHYSAAKAGVIGLTRALAKELGPSGITVNCVAPGVIETEMNAALDDQTRAALCEETPLGCIGTPEDIAKAVLYFADAPFVTGQILSPNGGIVI